MKKGLLSIPVAGVVVTLVVLGTSAAKPWSWDYTKNNKKINYCLLIGQTDHNDSQARTKGIRAALGTRPDVPEDSNPNTEKPVEGKMEFTFADEHKEVYNVEELEHKVCVADSGATWDQSTAINTCNTWYAKYQGKLTMMVSNNDGMAEGALYSSNSPKGIPIFGYDSNTSTLNLLKQGRIAGTINSNAPAQAAIMNILACRILDGTYVYDADPEKDWGNILGKLMEGILLIDRTSGEPIQGTQPVTKDGHYIKPKAIPETKEQTGFLTDILGKDIPFFYERSNHSLYVNSNKVISENVDDFRVDIEEQAHKIGAVESTTRSQGKYNIFYNTYSRTDTYLQGTMIPLVKQFRNMFAIEDTNIVDGNGNDDKEVLDAIRSAGDKFDAYIINMTKTETAEDYIKTIKGIVGDTKFKKMPIIFYNRQPFKNGAIDSEWMVPESNGGNPYVYYVGFDAEAGAKLQGEMIVEWLAKQAGAKSAKHI